MIKILIYELNLQQLKNIYSNNLGKGRKDCLERF